jgi:hypothetical protein
MRIMGQGEAIELHLNRQPQVETYTRFTVNELIVALSLWTGTYTSHMTKLGAADRPLVS